VRPPAVVTKQTGDLGDGEVKCAVAGDAGGVRKLAIASYEHPKRPHPPHLGVAQIQHAERDRSEVHCPAVVVDLF